MRIIRTDLAVCLAAVFLTVCFRAETANSSVNGQSRAADLGPGQTAGVTSSNGMEWSGRTMEVSPDAGQKSVVVTYTFRNSSAKPVHIKRVMASCDCVLAEAMSETVSPGKTGDIRVEFMLGARSGRQEKTITVMTGGTPETETTLNLIVNIPEEVCIAPKFVSWQIGEAAQEKAMEITLADPNKNRVSEVSCAEAGMFVRLVPGDAPGHYRVLARPVDTTKLLQATIRLGAAVSGRSRVFVLQASVK